MLKEVSPAVSAMREQIERHLTYTLAKDPEHASVYDWRMAVSFAIRDQIVAPWFEATRKAYATQAKRVFYLSMEFLIGRVIEDAMINLGLRDTIEQALSGSGWTLTQIIDDEPDAALGNGGLGRLAACFLESMSTLGCPAQGHGIRYEHGLFQQQFEGGQQVELPEEWLDQPHPWEFPRPEVQYTIPFKGHVEHRDGKSIWHPSESVFARAYDMPVIGWQGEWANTLRLWGASPTKHFDLARFNAGDYTAAAAPEALARTLSRVLYPDDTTDSGKELRLKQEFFLTSAALQDILRRFLTEYDDLAMLPDKVAIQLNDTHPAIAGPELMRLLVDVHGMDWVKAKAITKETLNYTNHTLLPEALERWLTWHMGNILPRHMEIIERLDEEHRAETGCPDTMGIVRHDEVHMGDLAFIMARRVNGVSELHTELIKDTVFEDLNRLHPGRIINETNGVTPRRWLRLANPPLAGLIDQTIGTGWTRNLSDLGKLVPQTESASFLKDVHKAKRANKVALSNWIKTELNLDIDPDALFDVQVKRIHEYKRQLLNIFETIALWQAIRAEPNANWTPRVKIFGGKAAPGYWLAKSIIRLINDTAVVINNDPITRDVLKVVYPPNFNVSMAERLIPAADLSEQISTAGKEASGTGNMKLTMNGALTIGTLDGANVEIRDQVGAENFFLFGLTAEEVAVQVRKPDHARIAIENSEKLQMVLQIIESGVLSEGDTGRYGDIIGRTRFDDPYLVATDFNAYWTCQREIDEVFRDRKRWDRMALMNIAQSGFFSSDRTIRGYMSDIWRVGSLL